MQATTERHKSLVYTDALLSQIEAVKIGLPAEYALAAAHGVERAVNEGVDLRPGSIDFRYAGYGEASSSALMFSKLGFAVAHLMCVPAEESSPELVDSLFGR